jgi:hypothetical protein
MDSFLVMRGSRPRWISTTATVVAGCCFLLPTSALATASAPVTASPTVAASPEAGIGVVSVVPATGTDLDPLTLVTSAMCPTGGTNVIGTILGPGLTAVGINVVPNSNAAIFPRTAGGGLYLPSNNTLRNLVNELPDPPVLKGTYQLRVECRGPAKLADLGDFYGSLVFDGHHAYKANEPNVPAASLTTIAAPSGPPIPTAVGSEAPRASSTGIPAAVKARSAAATTPSGNSSPAYAPWLVGVGVVIALAGLATVLRGRRRSNPTVGSR